MAFWKLENKSDVGRKYDLQCHGALYVNFDSANAHVEGIFYLFFSDSSFIICQMVRGIFSKLL